MYKLHILYNIFINTIYHIIIIEKLITKLIEFMPNIIIHYI